MRLASMTGLMVEEMHKKDAARCPHLATDRHAEATKSRALTTCTVKDCRLRTQSSTDPCILEHVSATSYL
jgi:hypothetical protein